MITALNVGNSILSRAFAENIDITPMKLQKLIYFVYRDYLKETNKGLFEERFEAWRYGPVLPSVYQVFKNYGSNSIKNYATEDDGKTVYTVDEDSSPVFKQIMNNVWKEGKKFNGIYLSTLTHRPESAWYKAVRKNETCLSNDDIREEEIAIA